MGQCQFCKEKAGFLRSMHSTCKTKNAETVIALTTRFKEAARGRALGTAKADAMRLATEGFVAQDAMQKALLAGLSQAVNDVFSDNLLSEEEETAMQAFLKTFEINQQMAPQTYTQLVKGGTLRDAMAGKISTRLKIDGDLPFNLAKGEQLAWIFSGVTLLEERTSTKYIGRSEGLSVRIAKGVYYRTSAFKGQPIQVTKMNAIEQGFLGATDRHLYFAGKSKAFRIPYGKIVAFKEFDDGIGVTKDSASGNMQVFRTGDGWFTYNLIRNLSNLNSAKDKPDAAAA